MEFLKEPLTLGMDPFSTDRIEIHRQILSKKRMIREVFEEFHMQMLAFRDSLLLMGHAEVELGAGVFPIKNTDKNVLATDILPAPHLDRVLDAQSLDLPNDSISVIYGQNCFHHFPDPQLFFNEATRVLKPGGGIILLEPHYGFLAEKIYKRLFSIEGYDKNEKSWSHLKNDLPNQARSYLCFIRDKKLFESICPELEIIAIKPSPNWIRYLLSGGLNFRQLVPEICIPMLKLLEWILKPFLNQLALHCYFVLRKKSDGAL